MSGMPPYPQPPYPQPPYGPPPSVFPPPAPRATSGLAIASIVCGIASYVVCVGAPLFAPLGLILGGIALKQSDGAVVRRGRGLAVAGVVLNAFGLVVAGLVLFYFTSQLYTARANESVRQAGKVDEDMYFIEERLRTYWRANGDSFGPGGPVLAGEKSRFARPPANGPKVSGVLKVSDLVAQDDLRHPLGEFSLTPTGKISAVIRHGPSGRELHIINIEARTSYINIGQ